jgi:NAD-dependent DNA ligase
VAPEITFSGHKFCFTGESTRATRTQMEALAFDRGGWVVKSVSPVVDYLVVGAAGNPCWAYACYGRKIEQAMQLRREGSKLLIVHEVDFFDAVA